ncbi:pyocin knob domain-containing protein, partial [Pseudomonas sp. BIOMIG1N]
DRANHTGTQLASTISDFSRAAVKRVIVSTGSIDDIKTPGQYAIIGPGSTSLPGAPVLEGVPRVNGFLDVTSLEQVSGAPLDTIMQEWHAPAAKPSWVRHWSSAQGWSAWTRVLYEGDCGVGAKSNAPFLGVNLNPDRYLTGGYVVGQFDIAPHGLRTGALISQAGSNETVCSQQFVDWADGRIYTRTMQSNVWNEWKKGLLAGDSGLGIADGIPIVSDCDTARTQGVYRCNPGALHAPRTTTYGTLEVSVHSKDSGCQTYTTTRGHAEGEQKFFRTFSGTGGMFSRWFEILKEGDYGIGGRSAVTIGSADAVPANGIFRITDGTPGGPGFFGTLTHHQHDDSSFIQTAINVSTGIMWVRQRLGGTTGQWKRVNMEGTYLPRNAQGSLTDLNAITGRQVLWADGSVKNIPLPGDWYVEVFGLEAGAVGDYCMQRASLLSVDSPVWTRKKINGVWFAWTQEHAGSGSIRMHDLNAVVGGGTYRYDPNSLNTPSAGTYGTLTIAMYDATNWTQTALTTAAHEMWVRGCTNGSIWPWRRVTLT